MDFIALFLFALVMTVTPGPNNMLLAASGARFGYRRTRPLVGGITAGLISQLALSALGLGILFDAYPVLYVILKTGGTAYILYLACKIAFGNKVKDKEDSGESPPGFIQGALFQYANPKAYVMTITALSVYSVPGEAYLKSVFVITTVFALTAPLSISLWACFGALLKQWTGSRERRGINYVLGMVTAASSLFILL